RHNRFSRLDTSNAIQRPLSLITQRRIACGRLQPLADCPCPWTNASKGTGRADANIEKLILQSFDQLRHSRVCGWANPCERLTRGPSNARDRIAQRSREIPCRSAGLRTDRRQRLASVNTDIRILMRESLD